MAQKGYVAENGRDGVTLDDLPLCIDPGDYLSRQKKNYYAAPIEILRVNLVTAYERIAQLERRIEALERAAESSDQ